MFRIFVILFVSMASYSAWAFPDTIRHGYTNCTACHATPAGGGLLTDYGRSLSRELMSTWSYQGEENFLHGAVELPEKFKEHVMVGGDARYLNRRYEPSSSKTDEGFLMQAQGRLGLVYENFKAIATFGKIENPRKSSQVELVSPEYYLLWSPKDEMYFRVGRFEPLFSLRLPDHNLWVKSEAGFVPWVERDTAEMIFEGERNLLSVSGFQSTSATNARMQSTGYAVSVYRVLREKTRVGFSGLNSEGQGVRSRVASLHSTITLSEATYWMLEISRVWSGDTTTDLGFSRLGHEVYKGVVPFVQNQLRWNRTQSQASSRHGLGLQFLPRPHFEVVTQWDWIKTPSETANEFLLLSHYYL